MEYQSQFVDLVFGLFEIVSLPAEKHMHLPPLFVKICSNRY